MAADYRSMYAQHRQGPLRANEFGFASLCTRLYDPAEPEVATSETTLRVTFGRSDTGGDLVKNWVDEFTQTEARAGRAGLSAASRVILDESSGRAPPRLVLICVSGPLSASPADIDALVREIKTSSSARVLVVGGSFEVRSALNSADGFVVAEPGLQSDLGPMALQSLHFALSAAHRLFCLDLDDVLPVAGDAHNPAILLQGDWQRGSDHGFRVSEDAKLVLRAPAAQRLLLMPRADRLRAAEIRALSDWAVSMAGSAPREVILAAPHDLPGAASLPGYLGTFAALTRRLADRQAYRAQVLGQR